MNTLRTIFTYVGGFVCIAPVVLAILFAFCHLLAKAQLRRKAKLTLP